MKTKFFIKNLSLFLLPLLIPLVTLGALSILISQNYITKDINRSSANLLRQTKENIELILSETDPMSLVYGNDYKIIDALSSILNNSTLTHEQLISYDLIKSFLSAPANARPYIDSFYIYLPNENGRFISSKAGLSELSNYPDFGWFRRFTEQDDAVKLWIEPRLIQPVSFQTEPVRMITIYQRINAPAGVIVLNILPAYIENILKSLSTSPEQCILVVNEKNEIVFSDKQPDYLNTLKLESINQSGKEFETLKTADDSFIVTQLNSARYGWKYISVIPQRALYQVPFAIVNITILLAVVSFLTAFVLAFYLTKRNYRRISSIIRIIDSAESGQPLPALPSPVQDEYGYIIQNIVKTFIERSYLNIQLSERRFKLQVAQMTALQAQINPHFLFNTLETLTWETIALTGRPNHLTKIIETLSEILRYSLTNPKELVTLETEIESVIHYMEIQKYRYEGKFDLVLDFEDEVKPFKVIKLLFQPIVENSIFHGIKEKEGKGHIKIKIRRVQAELHIALVDNGMGIDKDSLRMIRSHLLKAEEEEYSERIGLFNTNKRIKLAYGEQYGITIRSKYGYGTAVYMKIPVTE